MKAVRTAALRCVYKVVIILLIVTMSLAGCEEEKLEYEQFGYTLASDLITLGVRSDTDTFSIDNVSFDLYYGFFNLDSALRHEKGGYLRSDWENVFFVLYISEDDVINTFRTHATIDEYRGIKDYYIAREIGEEDAFSEEYGYTISRIHGIQYNHKERFTVPSNYFSKQSGKFTVSIVALLYQNEEKQQFMTAEVGYIELNYKKTDESNVRLIFKEN